MPKFALTAQIDSSMKQWNKGITERNSLLYLWYLLRLVSKMASYYVILCPPLGLSNAVLLVNCVLFCIVCVYFLTLGALCHFLKAHFPLSIRISEPKNVAQFSQIQKLHCTRIMHSVHSLPPWIYSILCSYSPFALMFSFIYLCIFINHLMCVFLSLLTSIFRARWIIH